jgi:hypothetical protein
MDTADSAVVPLHPDGEPPMTEHEMRIYWRAYGDGWRDCTETGADEQNTFSAGFLSGLQASIDYERAPTTRKPRHLKAVS